jgi:membrane-associated phospholipid phosphatase
MQTSDYLSPKSIKQLTSINFFIFVVLATFVIFNFLDMIIFEYSRSFPSIIFGFFKHVIDPLSDILDPFHVIIVCLVIILLNYNLKKLLQNPAKLNLIQKKSGLTKKKISNTFNYYSLISKHFFWSLAIAGIGCNLIKYILGVARPKYFFFEGFDRIDFFNALHKSNSFPSGHTQAAFTLAILIMIYFKKYHLYILSLAILMGLSRIFMTMHFPSDIFFGAYLGAIVPIILYQKIFSKKIKLYEQSGVVNLYYFSKLVYWRIFI